MAEKEYVDKESLIRHIECSFGEISTPFVVREIKGFPDADVVEVVRCKDCDLWNEWDSSGHRKLGNYVCSCAYWSCEDGRTIFTKPDDFCSYGERKE